MAQTNEHPLEQTQTLRCDVLLVTATNVETQAILDVFSRQNTSFKRYQIGLMLSGEKLARHKNFRKKLLSIEPEAIGGEMEGTGVYSAAYRTKVDWILIKAISDWADNHKDDTYQQQAAENAARFILHVLKQEGLAENKSGTPPSSQTSGEESSRRRAIGTIFRTYSVHTGWVLAVAWEPEGNRIASAGGDGVVRVWDAGSTETLLTYRGHAWLSEKVNWPPKIYTIAWSPEGLRLDLRRQDHPSLGCYHWQTDLKI